MRAWTSNQLKLTMALFLIKYIYIYIFSLCYYLRRCVFNCDDTFYLYFCPKSFLLIYVPVVILMILKCFKKCEFEEHHEEIRNNLHGTFVLKNKCLWSFRCPSLTLTKKDTTEKKQILWFRCNQRRSQTSLVHHRLCTSVEKCSTRLEPKTPVLQDWHVIHYATGQFIW